MNHQPSLVDLYNNHHGKLSDKWELYIKSWDDIFGTKQYAPLNILEIGIQNGGSLEIWAKYFSNAINIVGIDINPKCNELVFDDPRIHFVFGDANDDKTINRTTTLSKRFDIIIDDGSHISDDIIKTFFRYFPLLEDDGIYIIEDLHASYWEIFDGGLFHLTSSMTFFKKLVDILNFEHWKTPLSIRDYLIDFEGGYSNIFNETLFGKIHSIEFLNSMVVIKNRPYSENVLGRRYMSGSIETVSENTKIYQDYPISFFSKQMLDNTIMFDSKAIHEENKALKYQIESILQQNLELENNIYQLRNSRSWKITKPLRAIKTLFSKKRSER
jgi:hypothetical protein